MAVYGHTYGVSHALQACADDLDNVVIVAFPEFRGTATEEVFLLILTVPEIFNFFSQYFVKKDMIKV